MKTSGIIGSDPTPSAFVSMVRQKCPRCRRGNIFVYPIYHPKFMATYENCPHCNLKYEIEPGFFWGAMYFSYGFAVFTGVTSSILIYYLLHDPAIGIYLSILGGVLLALSPPIFRYSRVLMLYLFGSVRFNPDLFRKP